MRAPRFRRVTETLLASGVAIACLAGWHQEPASDSPLRVLFVGNSLTYINDMPATLAAIAASDGDTVVVAVAARPDLAIVDHLTGHSDAVEQLHRGRWNYVILQQGPTPAGMCRDSLVLWTQQFDPLIRAAGGTTAVLMTWPRAGHAEMWDEVRISFEAAASKVQGAFMPAGEAWRMALASDSTLPLYGPDGYHPSRLGTFLSALEIFERVTGHDARALPPKAFANGREIQVPIATIRSLQNAAHEANQRYPATVAPSAEELAQPPNHRSAANHC